MPKATPARKNALDLGDPQAAREALEALAQAWIEGPDDSEGRRQWINAQGAGILWRWGWHFPQHAQQLAAQAQLEQVQRCCGFALMGSWEAQGVEPPLRFKMWTQEEPGEGSVDVQWAICETPKAKSFPGALIQSATLAFECLADSACASEEWHGTKEGAFERCGASEFFFQRLPGATVGLARSGVQPAVGAALAGALISQDLHENTEANPASSPKPRL